MSKVQSQYDAYLEELLTGKVSPESLEFKKYFEKREEEKRSDRVEAKKILELLKLEQALYKVKRAGLLTQETYDEGRRKILSRVGIGILS